MTVLQHGVLFGLCIVICLSSAPNCEQCSEKRTEVECPSFVNTKYKIKVSTFVDEIGTVKWRAMDISCRFSDKLETDIKDCIPPGAINDIILFSCIIPTPFSVLFDAIGLNSSVIEQMGFVSPKNDIFSLVASDFDGLHNLKKFSLINANLSINGKVFSLTPQLEMLSFVYIILQQPFNKDAFDNIENLTNVVITGSNEMISLYDDIFKNNDQLKYIRVVQNDIAVVTNSHFTNLTSLKYLNLQYNWIKSVQPNSLSNMPVLEEIDLRWNELVELPLNLFWECPKLKNVYLQSNKLQAVPDTMFHMSPGVKVIGLSENYLTTIPEAFLETLIYLTEFDASKNNITTIPDMLFRSNRNLEILRLDTNLILDLFENIFENATKLKKVHLENNSLTFTPSFSSCFMLEELHLQMNTLSALLYRHFPKNILRFEHVSKLFYIDASHNRLNESGVVQDGRFALLWQGNLVEINLSFNEFQMSPIDADFIFLRKLKTINLSNNFIEFVNLTDFLKLPKNLEINFKDNLLTRVEISQNIQIQPLKLHLGGNKLSCDCNLFNLAKWLRASAQRSSFPKLKIYDWKDLVCDTPVELANRTIYSLDYDNFVCRKPVNECSPFCPCTFRPVDKMVILECSFKELKGIPSFYNLLDWNYTLDLSHNNLSTFSLSNVRDTDMKFSSVADSKNLRTFPENLKIMNLSYNQITSLPKVFVNILDQHAVQMHLENNPWYCDCNLEHLLQYMRTQSRKINDIDKLKCHKNSKLLIDVTMSEVCPFYLQPTFIAVVSISSVIILVIAATVSTLIHRNHMAIKVWLFKRRLCLCLVLEEDLDIDKTYDAFVCYAHEDEDFVMETLVPGLENGTPQYKTCLHHRDWMPGEFIQRQIIDSVADSRRTIVILSANFIKSDWGKMEFRVAHKQALRDNTNRVIVITYGEIPAVESMDSELRYYVQLRTYLKWDSPNFWDQLRFTMPHKEYIKGRRRKPQNDNNIKLQSR